VHRIRGTVEVKVRVQQEFSQSPSPILSRTQSGNAMQEHEQRNSSSSTDKRLLPLDKISEVRPKSGKIALKLGKLNSGRFSNMFSIHDNKARIYETAGVRSQLNYGSAYPPSRSPDSDKFKSVGVLPASKFIISGHRFKQVGLKNVKTSKGIGSRQNESRPGDDSKTQATEITSYAKNTIAQSQLGPASNLSENE
jgi:hypothetical protein